MFLAAVAVTAILSAVLVSSSLAVARRDQKAMAMLDRVAAAHLAPAVTFTGLALPVGLLAGLAITPLGVAAGFGALAYMGAALVSHLRAGDPDVAPALVIAALAAAALTLRLLTA